MALNFLSSTASNLSGNFIGDDSMKSFCTFNGFMTQWFVVQSKSQCCGSRIFSELTDYVADYWVLTIAMCTYFIISDWKRTAKWIQEHPGIVFCIPPLVSGTWALIGVGLHAYANIGACKFGPYPTNRILLTKWHRVLVSQRPNTPPGKLHPALAHHIHLSVRVPPSLHHHIQVA
jgi:hypothetical protein